MPLNTTTKSYQGFTHTVTGQGHTVTENMSVEKKHVLS